MPQRGARDAKGRKARNTNLEIRSAKLRPRAEILLRQGYGGRGWPRRQFTRCKCSDPLDWGKWPHRRVSPYECLDFIRSKILTDLRFSLPLTGLELSHRLFIASSKLNSKKPIWGFGEAGLAKAGGVPTQLSEIDNFAGRGGAAVV